MGRGKGDVSWEQVVVLLALQVKTQVHQLTGPNSRSSSCPTQCKGRAPDPPTRVCLLLFLAQPWQAQI